MSDSNDRKRPVRSYVIRSGRLTESQRNALDEHWQDYVIDFQPEVIDFQAHFPSVGRLTVEIGFGMGDSLLAMASEQPDRNFLGVEVHRPGIGKLMRGIHALGLSNIKLMCHDAVEVLSHCFGLQSIDQVLVFFPDPWPKKRHHKRRIVNPPFVKLLSSRLKQDGVLHLATDWEPYAQHMLEVLERETALTNCNGPRQYREEPQRPVTKFEARGRRLGHGVWDLQYRKLYPGS